MGMGLANVHLGMELANVPWDCDYPMLPRNGNVPWEWD